MRRLLLIRGAELIVFALLATIPLLVVNPYALGLLTLLAIYGILLIGLDVTVGYLGQVNLSQAAFLGLGAYTAGLCVDRLGWGMLLAALAATVVGVILGALESIASYSLGSGWREAPGLILLILALAVRPTGVFGKATIRKV